MENQAAELTTTRSMWDASFHAAQVAGHQVTFGKSAVTPDV